MRSAKARKDFNVRSALPKRFDRLVRDLQVVMSVGRLQVPVFKKCRGRQNDVRIVSRIGKKLLMDYGEQIGAPQTADHFVVVGTNGCGIGVVNEQSFDRRIVQLI